MDPPWTLQWKAPFSKVMEDGKRKGWGLTEESGLEKTKSFPGGLRWWTVCHRGVVSSAQCCSSKTWKKRQQEKLQRVLEARKYLAESWCSFWEVRQSQHMQMFARYGNRQWLTQFWKKPSCSFPCSRLQRQLSVFAIKHNSLHPIFCIAEFHRRA